MNSNILNYFKTHVQNKNIIICHVLTICDKTGEVFWKEGSIYSYRAE